MADYHPLITRAVNALEKDTAENRRVLYERARTALVSQLRGTVPPLDEAEITRERLALEEAIRRVEVESARRAREAKDAAKDFAKDSPRSVPELDAVIAKPVTETARRKEIARAEPVTSPRPLPLSPPAEPIPRALAVSESAPATIASPAIPQREIERPKDLPQAEAAERLDDALEEFRDLSKDAAALREGARAEPPRPTIAPMSGSAAAPRPVSSPKPPMQPASPPQSPIEALRELESYEPQLAHDEWQAPSAERVRPMQRYDRDDAGFKPPRAEPAEQSDEPARPIRPLWAYGRLVRNAILLLCIVGAGAAIYWQRDVFAGAARGLWASVRGPTTQVQKDATPVRQKDTARVGQPDTQAPVKGAAKDTQRAMLTTEPDANNPGGKDYVGSAVWRTEMIAAGQGRAAELAIKLDVEIPDRGFAMTWTIKRNTDATLPATHTIEIEFNIAPNSPLGTVAEIRSLLMKQPNQTEGSPLWGHAQRSTPNYFLVGLSANSADAQYNLRLLKEQSAFDIALVFTKARRAFLLIEKGQVGERVFAEAFAAWKQ